MSDFRIPQTAEEWAAIKPTNDECTLVEVWHRGAFGEEAYAPAVIHFARLAAVSRMVEHEWCVRRLAGYLSTLPGNTDKHPSEMLPEARRILEDKP